jgi:phosphoenolpyruvate carboxylase
VRELKRRLTFAGVETILSELEQMLFREIFDSEQNSFLNREEILEPLVNIRALLDEKYNGLFVHLVDNFIYKVKLFGLHFASLDIRQDSQVHGEVLEQIAQQSDALPDNYNSLGPEQKIDILSGIGQAVDAETFSDEMVKDTLKTIGAVKIIQEQNGSEGCERYIISQCQTALNAMEVFGLYLLGGWKREEITVDIVPLFETIGDLKQAAVVMQQLYKHQPYREHLARRGNTQTIMLGFSDGTKDGGYLMANWSIYKAKEELTRVSKDYAVDVIFFDGRGGPPARGGGKTHKFYSSMGENVSNKAIELTIQGQTVSSNFATIDAAQYNIEQLLHAGIYNHIFNRKESTFAGDEEKLMNDLAGESYAAYETLKNDPAFLSYLLHASPLPFYSDTNIGSRPAKRGDSNTLELKDLRAIPFVGAWSQIKQNVPGYFGVGSALRKIEKEGSLDQVIAMYQHNAFFKALMDNCEMAMQKSYFPLTRFLSEAQSCWSRLCRPRHQCSFGECRPPGPATHG